MEAKLKKEKGNEAVRQFRIRQKEKELADKERAEMLRKENMEMEIRVASYQQELDFMVAVVKAHTEVDGDVFLNNDPSLREILHQQNWALRLCCKFFLFLTKLDPQQPQRWCLMFW